MRKRLIPHNIVWVSALLIFGGSNYIHGGGLINTGYFGGIAIKGYDPVAYFTMGRATKGSKEFAYKWLGTPWYFANAKHRELFAADPVKYAPQFGGYCSLGVAYGQNSANIDPEAWTIIDGKLYLNFNKGSAAVLKETPDELTKAKANWPKVKARLTQ
jgi:YHS domain-containing protein